LGAADAGVVVGPRRADEEDIFGGLVDAGDRNSHVGAPAQRSQGQVAGRRQDHDALERALAAV
jgi:hypothetical protein